MTKKTWIYLTILMVVLVGAGIFFWWIYLRGAVSPKAETQPSTLTQTFSDVPVGDPNDSYKGQYWAYNQIEAVNQKGWMVGWTITQFKPEERATRATLAVAVARAYNKSFDNPTPSFSDVPKTYWAYKEIEGLKQAGWVNGFGDTTFRPDENATLADLAVLFARAHTDNQVPVVDPSLPSIYPDVPTTYPSYDEIIFVSNHSPYIMRGDGTGKFSPELAATRGALATTLQKDKQLDISNPPATPSFSDVASDNPYYVTIEAVKTAGYMNGYPTTKEFRPDDLADRATVAMAIARASNNILAGVAATFSDVPVGYWAFNEIEGLNKAGIMTGYDATTFCPDTNACTADKAIATRSTAAVVIARAKKLTLEPNGEQVFADLKSGQFGYAEANAMYKAGYTKGCGIDNDTNSPTYGKPKYCPDEQITRAVLAAFIHNAFVLTTPTVPPAPPETPTPVSSSSNSNTGSTNNGSSGDAGSAGSGSANTGAEVPLAGAGILSGLFAIRYLIGKRIVK